MTWFRLQIVQAGEPHVITFNSYYSTPHIKTNDGMYGPVNVVTGPGAMQMATGAGRVETIPVTQEFVPGVCHADSGSIGRYTWTQVTAERGDNAHAPIYWWLQGLKSTDRVRMYAGSHTEFIPWGAIPSISGADKFVVVPSNAGASDIVSAAGDAARSTGSDKGLTANPQERNMLDKFIDTTVKAMSAWDKTENITRRIFDGFKDIVSAVSTVGKYTPWLSPFKWGAVYTGSRRVLTEKGFATAPPLLNCYHPRGLVDSSLSSSSSLARMPPPPDIRDEAKDDSYDFPRRESIPMETPRQSLRLRPPDSRASQATAQAVAAK